MYLYKQKTPKGDVYLAIKEKEYIPKVGTREHTIEKIGYLSELKKKYDDPIEHFQQYARELTEKSKKNTTVNIVIDTAETMNNDTDDVRNAGYGILKQLYRDLELDVFWNRKTFRRKTEFSTDKIFRLLVFSRALNPGSKKYTVENSSFFEPYDGFTLDDMYHSLDIMAENSNELQRWIFDHSKNICHRDLSTSYFDCTNYYFDIGRPDTDILDADGNPVDKNGNPTAPSYRKRGPEKNHRPDPIIEMGLLMDRNGIPVAYDLFPGNESEKVHMRPVISRIHKDFEDTRIIIVADRGLNTSDNIYWLNGDNKTEDNKRDGYVYGQSVRGASEEFKNWVLEKGYSAISTTDDEGATYTCKTRITPRKIHVNVTNPGKGKPSKTAVEIDQKQLVYYSEKYAKKQKADRAAMIARAEDLIRHPKKYDRITSKGSSAYICNIAFNKDTGEIIANREMYLDTEKIAEEEKYDGYYSIVTSELKMSAEEMIAVYRGLGRIEDAFKVTKTYCRARPVYVRKKEHIEAHFATCFTALVLLRLLEIKLGNKFPLGKILDALKKYNCVKIGSNLWQFVFYNEIIAECEKAFNMDLKTKYHSRDEIRKMLRY